MSKAGDIYRKIHGKITKRPTNFSWIIDGKLAGTGRPILQNLQEMGIPDDQTGMTTRTKFSFVIRWQD